MLGAHAGPFLYTHHHTLSHIIAVGMRRRRHNKSFEGRELGKKKKRNIRKNHQCHLDALEHVLVAEQHGVGGGLAGHVLEKVLLDQPQTLHALPHSLHRVEPVASITSDR